MSATPQKSVCPLRSDVESSSQPRSLKRRVLARAHMRSMSLFWPHLACPRRSRPAHGADWGVHTECVWLRAKCEYWGWCKRLRSFKTAHHDLRAPYLLGGGGGCVYGCVRPRCGCPRPRSSPPHLPVVIGQNERGLVSNVGSTSSQRRRCSWRCITCMIELRCAAVRPDHFLTFRPFSQ